MSCASLDRSVRGSALRFDPRLLSGNPSGRDPIDSPQGGLINDVASPPLRSG